MYEEYTKQSLPSKNYRELLGSALCVFNSNNNFIIENILKVNDNDYSWYSLIDKESGKLHTAINHTITSYSNQKIAHLFKEIVYKRNRIIHSFQITDHNGEQRLATKDRDNKQYVITEDYLLSFIKGNEKLSSLLYEFRGDL